MIKSGSTPRLQTIGAKIQFLGRFKWLFSLVVAVVFTVAATPPPDQTLPDEQYIQIITLIDRADALRVAGQTDAAKLKYREAQRQLLYFKAINPLFAPKTVNYRLNELNGRLETRAPVTMTNSPTSSKTNLEAASPVPKSSVKLIDAGAEPRKALRFHIAPADKQSVIMTLKVNIEAASAPGAPAVTNPIPAMTIPWDVTIQNVAANGDISYEAVLGEVNVVADTNAPPGAAQAAKGVFAALKGTITGVISSSGISKKVDGKAPAGLDIKLRQIYEITKAAIAAPSISLPDEAIGGGAKWEVKVPIKSQGGVSIDQTQAFELVSVDGDHLKATFTGTVSAANAKTPGPVITASGTIDADLSKLVASEMVVNIHSESPGTKEMPSGGKMDMNETIVTK